MLLCCILDVYIYVYICKTQIDVQPLIDLKSKSDFYVTDICTSDLCPFFSTWRLMTSHPLAVPEMRASLWLARKKFFGPVKNNGRMVAQSFCDIQGNFGRYRCAAEIAKTPQCIYCYLMKPEFTCYNLFDNLDAIG